MFSKNPKSCVIAACLIGVAGVLPAAAELPIMTEKEWLGYYLGHKSRTFQFGVSGQGQTSIKVIGKKGEPLSQQLAIGVNFLVEEILPDGKVVTRKVEGSSLQSDTPATNEVDNVIIKGKAGKDTGVEIYIDEDRGAMMLGGRVVEAGSIKNPLRFAVEVKFQNVYPYDKKGGEKELKAFQEKIQDDRMQVVLASGKRGKHSTSEVIDAKTTSGDGLKSIELEFSSYQGKRFEFTASDNSALHLSNASPGPLHEGFSLTWSANPEKDPQGKARFAIVIK